MLIPHLEKGMKYNDACSAAGIDFKAHNGNQKSKYLHPTEDDYANITSPVVKRAVSQTFKVINAIIRKQGCSPTFINIELAREMAKDFKERNKLKKENDENQARNERLLERIRTEYGKSNPTGLDLVKLKLYEEQQGKPFAVAVLDRKTEILRGCTARYLAVYGFLPVLGLHHRSELNDFNLADDLMEPFRPVVDMIVSDLFEEETILTPQKKRLLFNCLNLDILSGGQHHSVAYAIEREVKSLSRSLMDQENRLLLPELLELKQHRYE